MEYTIDMKKCLFISILLASFCSFGQQEDSRVKIYMDPKIDSMVKARCGVDVPMPWRAQLAFSVKKEDLVGLQKRFRTYHKEMECEILFDSPYWMLRAGRFETESEAQEFIETVRKWYPDSHPVKPYKR